VSGRHRVRFVRVSFVARAIAARSAMGCLGAAALLGMSACANIWGFEDLGDSTGSGGDGGAGANGAGGGGAAGSGGPSADSGAGGQSGAGGSEKGNGGMSGAGAGVVFDDASAAGGQAGTGAAVDGSVAIDGSESDGPGTQGTDDAAVSDARGDGGPTDGARGPAIGPDADVVVRAGNDGGATPDTGVCVGTTRQLLTNGSFEQGETGWLVSVAGGFPIVYVATGAGGTAPDVIAQSPPNVTWIGGYARADDSISQNITFPASATSMTLTFFYAIVTRELGPIENDAMDVQIMAGAQTLSLAHFGNQNAVSAWTRFSAALPSSLAGQTVTLRFHGTTNPTATTSFYVDTVSVQVVTCP
jgi:hypothetical protein